MGSIAVRRSVALTVAVMVSLGFVAAGCSSRSKQPSGASGTTTTVTRAPATGAITVSAAASLTGAFDTIKDGFVKANPDATVTINFGSSGQLETQIESGAPADVAAFADEATTKKLTDQNLAAGPSQDFATNLLVILTKPGNPKGIETLADLATAGTISLCATTAPCGKYADQILRGATVTIPESSVTRGQDVKTTLTAVTTGDADAALVYVTDAQAAGTRVTAVEIPASQNAVARYPIAILSASSNPSAAQAFVVYVLGPEAQAVLKEAGFQAP
jgi:molybdate transport system substrate-binding protein